MTAAAVQARSCRHPGCDRTPSIPMRSTDAPVSGVTDAPGHAGPESQDNECGPPGPSGSLHPPSACHRAVTQGLHGRTAAMQQKP
ncbi:hypothetical protein HVIM_04289 [Roseomonas mucosa]|nr:hypothetical protein HVIM_04289 [Roseomonas mucosa]UZO93357.1 Hypothetical protein RMP42_04289 [Roseomonas mucosa]